MSEYIKLEDVIRLIDDAFDSIPIEKTVEILKVRKTIRSLPTIDIVRCEECMYKYVTGDTTQYYVCDFMDAQYNKNGYCHHGEREEE